MSVAETGGGVAVLYPVVRRLFPRRIPRKPSPLSQLIKLRGAACDDLVHIGLVAGVPQDGIVGRIEHPVDGQGQLHHSEVRAEMPARCRDFLHDELAYLFAESVKLGSAQASQVAGMSDVG